MFNLKKLKNKNSKPETNHGFATTPVNIGVSSRNERGFMLVEMIISVAVFSVVMTVGIGSLLSIINANKRAQAFKTVVNNLNLAVESMSRDIRFGYDYRCGDLHGSSCPAGDDSIFFTSKTGTDMAYKLNNNSIEKFVENGAYTAITAPDVIIDRLDFYVFVPYTDSSYQPKVIIVVQGHTGETSRERMDFNLYTSVSQRKLGN